MNVKGDEEHARRRAEIIDAARKRFRYYGPKKTTMREIAEDVGLAVGTLYLYFKDKDALLLAGVEDFIIRHRQQIDALLASPIPAAEKIRQYLVGRFREYEAIRTSSPHAMELSREVVRVKPDRLQEEGAMLHDFVLRVLQQGVARHEFHIDDPEADAAVFMHSIAYSLPNNLVEVPRPAQEADLLLVVNWFIRVWSTGSGVDRELSCLNERTMPGERIAAVSELKSESPRPGGSTKGHQC